MTKVWVVMMEGYCGKEIVSIHDSWESARKAADECMSFAWIISYDVVK